MVKQFSWRIRIFSTENIILSYQIVKEEKHRILIDLKVTIMLFCPTFCKTRWQTLSLSHCLIESNSLNNLKSKAVKDTIQIKVLKEDSKIGAWHSSKLMISILNRRQISSSMVKSRKIYKILRLLILDFY